MESSNLTEDEKKNINCMWKTILNDQLINLTRSKSNKVANWEAQTEFQAAEQEKNPNVANGEMDNQENGHLQRSNKPEVRKNVSFAQPSQKQCRLNQSNVTMEPDYSVMNEVDDDMNQQQINQFVEQDHDDSLHGLFGTDPFRPSNQTPVTNHSRLDTSQLWQNPFEDRPTAQVNQNIDMEVFVAIMAECKKKGQVDPFFDNVMEFKASLLQRRHPAEIIQMYKDITTENIEDCQPEDSYLQESNNQTNPAIDQEREKCPVCMDYFSDDNQFEVTWDKEALAFESCYHVVHQACMIDWCVVNNNYENLICVTCKNQINNSDTQAIDEFIAKNFKFENLKQYIIEKKGISSLN